MFLCIYFLLTIINFLGGFLIWCWFFKCGLCWSLMVTPPLVVLVQMVGELPRVLAAGDPVKYGKRLGRVG